VQFRWLCTVQKRRASHVKSNELEGLLWTVDVDVSGSLNVGMGSSVYVNLQWHVMVAAVVNYRTIW